MMGTANSDDTTPLSVYLPFNREVLGIDFSPGKGGAVPKEGEGHWVLVQDQNLLVVPEGEQFRLPSGACPIDVDGESPIWLGSLQGTPCWVLPVAKGRACPDGLQPQTLIPMRGTKLPDTLLSLGGMAMQALWWESTSGHCPRCGERTDRISGEWGKKCPKCQYEHYPHLHPAVITLVIDGDRCLLARKREWAPGRYALVAGFVDNGESLEGCVRREVKEEVGVDVKNIRYVGSQNWPFPSQLMVGFVAEYAGGDITVDTEELEDARWFPRDQLPISPSRHSIAGYIIKNYAPK
jgi:NAD+ diphosphatase